MKKCTWDASKMGGFLFEGYLKKYELTNQEEISTLMNMVQILEHNPADIFSLHWILLSLCGKLKKIGK